MMSGDAIRRQVGENLRRYCRQAGPSQEEVGIRASLHRTEIGLLERGERMPRVDTALKLAGAVGVPLSALVEGIEWLPGDSHRGAFDVAVESQSGGDLVSPGIQGAGKSWR
jgi:transcriptional regulator with XRE-family HTH domain